MNTPISFRLRKGVDDDLHQALAEFEKNKIADLARNGLRLMLGIRTTKHTQIVERPIWKTDPPLEQSAIFSAKIGSSQQRPLGIGTAIKKESDRDVPKR